MEFIPKAQLPTGLAEQVLSLKSQRVNPLQTLAETIGGLGKTYFDVKRKKIEEKDVLERDLAKEAMKGVISGELKLPKGVDFDKIDWSNIHKVAIPISSEERIELKRKIGSVSPGAGEVPTEMVDAENMRRKATSPNLPLLPYVINLATFTQAQKQTESIVNIDLKRKEAGKEPLEDLKKRHDILQATLLRMKPMLQSEEQQKEAQALSKGLEVLKKEIKNAEKELGKISPLLLEPLEPKITEQIETSGKEPTSLQLKAAKIIEIYRSKIPDWQYSPDKEKTVRASLAQGGVDVPLQDSIIAELNKQYYARITGR